MRQRLSGIVVFVVLVVIIGIVFLKSGLAGKGGEEKKIRVTQSTSRPAENLSMDIQSTAFGHNGFIPRKYTCDGEDINPPFTFSGIPQEAKSLVLIVDDPDAPAKVWSHWLLWNISPTTKEIEEDSIPTGAVQGKNDFGKNNYGGPCPPAGKPHRYRFKLFALDRELGLSENSRQRDIEQAVKGHVLAQAELVGRYGR